MFGLKRHWNNAIKGGQWHARIASELRNYDEAKYDSIAVSTSGVCDPYDVIETIFCAESADNDRGLGGIQVLFPRTLQNLRVQCSLMNGDAVINAQFEHRSALGDSFFGGKKQVFEIFAFGTVVKYRNSQLNNISATSAVLEHTLSPNTEQSANNFTTGSVSNSIKWKSLIEVDTEIATEYERVKALGDEFGEEFAEKYLALNDKNYLKNLSDKIVRAVADKENLEKLAKVKMTELGMSELQYNFYERFKKRIEDNLGIFEPGVRVIEILPYNNRDRGAFKDGLLVHLDDGSSLLVSNEIINLNPPQKRLFTAQEKDMWLK